MTGDAGAAGGSKPVDEPRDAYEVLQVSPSAGDEVVRAAYRALAQRYHPDIAGPEGEVRMREINAAWDAIGDPGRRAEYDRARAKERPRRTPWTTPAPSQSAPQPQQPEPATGSARPSSAPLWTGAAGPPPGRPAGTILNFGIYSGWSLGEIAHHDAGYLQWLEQKPEGRPYLAEIDAILKRLGVRETPTDAASKRPRRGNGIFGR
jgi:curved DNA-binding protein CbpA